MIRALVAMGLGSGISSCGSSSAEATPSPSLANNNSSSIVFNLSPVQKLTFLAILFSNSIFLM